MPKPSARRREAPIRIEVLTYETVVGPVSLAASERGVVRVILPGTPIEELLEPLLRRHPRLQLARLDAPSAWLAPATRALDALLEGDVVEPPALDVVATEFERAVWQAIGAIARGETRSYRQIAEAVGQPKASRAVGQACSANPVPILVPCHRVMGHRGSLVGFGGGLDMKAKLLARERVLLT